MSEVKTNKISSLASNNNITIDPDGTGVVDVVGTLQSDGLTVDGDVTLNDGSPNLRLKDTDTNRFVDLLYGTRVATIRNTMAAGEDIDTVEPSMVFSFKDDSETRTALTIDHDANVIASGKVGIGTSSPAALLTMVAADGVMADQYVAKFTNSEATAGQNYGVFVAGGSTSADESFSVRKFDNSATYLKVRGDGVITMPNQPAFQVYKSSNDQNNIAADNSSVVVTWSAEAFDIGSNFASNTFTAPVTGKYLLTAKLRISDPDSASQYYILKLVCSNGDSFDIFDSNEYSSDLDYLTLQVTIVQDMDANDTAQVQITQQGGTSQSDIIGARHYSNFSGYLLG